jgi:hypothetical protein
MGWFSRKKPSEAGQLPDQPRTSLELRVEALEARVRRVVDDQAELEDGIARRLDKYRKRVEREDPGTAAEAPAQAPSPRTVPNGARVLPFDPLAVRRGPGRFPGGSR